MDISSQPAIIQSTPNLGPLSKKDIMDLTKVYAAKDIPLTEDGEVVKYINTGLEEEGLDVREDGGTKNKQKFKIQLKEMFIKEHGVVYYTLEERSLEGLLMNRQQYKNEFKIKLSTDVKSQYGLHLALASMKFGEKAVFRVSPLYRRSLESLSTQGGRVIQVFTESQQQQVEKMQTENMIWIVKFRNFKNEIQLQKITYQERIDLSEKYNQLARSNFLQGKVGQAIKNYKYIQSICDGVPNVIKSDWTPEQSVRILEELSRSYSNIAVCYVKQGQQWALVKEYAEKAKSKNQANQKAHMLIGRQFYERALYEEAIEYFGTCMQYLDEAMKKEAEHYVALSTKYKEQIQDKKYNRLLQNMINNVGKDDPQEEQRQLKEKIEQVACKRQKEGVLKQVEQGSIMDPKQIMKLL